MSHFSLPIVLIRLFIQKTQVGEKAGTLHWMTVKDRVLPEADNFDAVSNLSVEYELERQDTYNGLLGFGDFRYFVSLGPVTSIKKAFEAYKRKERWGPAGALCQKLGRLETVRGASIAARCYFEEAVELARKVGSKINEANGLLGLSDVAMALSRNGEARRNIEPALALYREAQDRMGEANALYHMAQLVERTSEPKDSRDFLLQSQILYGTVGSIVGEANVNFSISRMDGVEPAAYEPIIEIYERAGSTSSIGNVLIYQAELYAKQGDLEKARKLFERAIETSRSVEGGFLEANCLVKRGICIKYYGNDVDADSDLNAGYDIFFSLSSSEDLAVIGWRNLKLGLQAKTEDEAQAHLSAATNEWQAIGRFDLVRDWIPDVAVVHRYYHYS